MVDGRLRELVADVNVLVEAAGLKAVVKKVIVKTKVKKVMKKRRYKRWW